MEMADEPYIIISDIFSLIFVFHWFRKISFFASRNTEDR